VTATTKDNTNPPIATTENNNTNHPKATAEDNNDEEDDSPVDLSVRDIKDQVRNDPLEDEGYSGDSEDDDLDDFIENDDEGIVIYEQGHDYYLSPHQRTSYGNDFGIGFCICAICKAFTSNKQLQEDPGFELIQCRAKNDMTKNRRIGCMYKFHLKCLKFASPPRGEWICACCMAKHMSIFGPKETTQVTKKGYAFSPSFPAEESDVEEKEWREVFLGKRDAVTKKDEAKKPPTKKLRKKRGRRTPLWRMTWKWTKTWKTPTVMNPYPTSLGERRTNVLDVRKLSLEAMHPAGILLVIHPRKSKPLGQIMNRMKMDIPFARLNTTASRQPSHRKRTRKMTKRTKRRN
jgi:hypothetical protein